MQDLCFRPSGPRRDVLSCLSDGVYLCLGDSKCEREKERGWPTEVIDNVIAILCCEPKRDRRPDTFSAAATLLVQPLELLQTFANCSR